MPTRNPSQLSRTPAYTEWTTDTACLQSYQRAAVNSQSASLVYVSLVAGRNVSKYALRILHPLTLRQIVVRTKPTVHNYVNFLFAPIQCFARILK